MRSDVPHIKRSSNCKCEQQLGNIVGLVRRSTSPARKIVGELDGGFGKIQIILITPSILGNFQGSAGIDKMSIKLPFAIESLVTDVFPAPTVEMDVLYFGDVDCGAELRHVSCQGEKPPLAQEGDVVFLVDQG